MKHFFFSLLLISNLAVISQPVNDIAVGPFLSLPAQFFTGNTYNIKARVTNAGTSNQTNIPAKFSVNGIQIGSGVIPFLLSGASDSISFSWMPTIIGYYTLRIYSALANDENRFNDTVTTTIYVLPAGYNGPQTTVCRNNINKIIMDPPSAGVFDTINISIPNACVIWDVNVKIDTILHTWISDLIITLFHGAQRDTIFRNQGGSGDNIIGVTFNDSAGPPPPPPPFYNGTYKPFRPLYIFNGYPVNGPWILHIQDMYAGDTGYLKAWCVQIVYQPCIGINSNNENAEIYSLSQNYPNPFNPVTTIIYSIPKSGQVNLMVYDLLGREISTLVNEIKQPGTYTAYFDGTGLSSGVYVYKITSGEFTDIKKMVLIK